MFLFVIVLLSPHITSSSIYRLPLRKSTLIAIRLTKYAKKQNIDISGLFVLFLLQSVEWITKALLGETLKCFDFFLYLFSLTPIVIFPKFAFTPCFNFIICFPSWTFSSIVAWVWLNHDQKFNAEWIISRVSVWWIVHVPSIKLHASQWKEQLIDFACQIFWQSAISYRRRSHRCWY